jgi:hypothetical protein
MNKAAIIINPDLPLGILTNAVACIASGLFLEGRELVGAEITGKGINYIPITKIPILILKPGNKSFPEILNQAQSMGLKYMAFTKEAQSTTDYDIYEKRVSGVPIESVSIIGIGVVGATKTVNSLVGSLPMLR